MASITRKRRAFTAKQRQAWIRRWRESGLTQVEFSRRMKLHPVTFSKWRRAARASRPAFAEVQVSTVTPAPADAAVVLLLPSGAKVEVSVTSEAGWHGLGVMLNGLRACTP